MNGQMRTYKERLEITPGPIMFKDWEPIKIDMRNMIKYAKEKGVKPIELSDEEKKMFISEIEDK